MAEPREKVRHSLQNGYFFLEKEPFPVSRIHVDVMETKGKKNDFLIPMIDTPKLNGLSTLPTSFLTEKG